MTYHLPYDDARCACSQPCPERDTCARFTDPGREQWQVRIDASVMLVGKPCMLYVNNETGEMHPMEGRDE